MIMNCTVEVASHPSSLLPYREHSKLTNISHRQLGHMWIIYHAMLSGELMNLINERQVCTYLFLPHFYTQYLSTFRALATDSLLNLVLVHKIFFILYPSLSRMQTDNSLAWGFHK